MRIRDDDAQALAARRKILLEEIERIKTTTDQVEAAEFLDISSKWKNLIAAEAKLEEKERRASNQRGTQGKARNRSRLSGL